MEHLEERLGLADRMIKKWKPKWNICIDSGVVANLSPVALLWSGLGRMLVFRR